MVKKLYFFFLMWLLFEKPETNQRNEGNSSAIKGVLAPERQARQLAQHGTPQGRGFENAII